MFGFDPRDVFPIALACLLLGAVALLASLVPAWRAARVEPLRPFTCSRPPHTADRLVAHRRRSKSQLVGLAAWERRSDARRVDLPRDDLAPASARAKRRTEREPRSRQDHGFTQHQANQMATTRAERDADERLFLRKLEAALRGAMPNRRSFWAIRLATASIVDSKSRCVESI